MTLIDGIRAARTEQGAGVGGQNPEVAGGSVANTMAGLASLGARASMSARSMPDRLAPSSPPRSEEYGRRLPTPLGDKAPLAASSDRGHGRRPAQHEYLFRRLPQADAR